MNFVIKCFLLLLGTLKILGYQIPDLIFKALDNEFSISIPHNDDIDEVLYAIEINQQCPAIFDYLIERQHYKKENWTTRHTRHLNEGDSLDVILMVQTVNGNIYKKDDKFKIQKNNNAIKLDVLKDLTSTYQGCSLEASPTAPQCKTSQTVWDIYTPCEGDEIFMEDFSEKRASGFDNNWKYDISIRVNGDGDEEFVWFKKDDKTSEFRNGIFHIKPIIYNHNNNNNIRHGNITLEDCTSHIEKECKIIADSGRDFLPPIMSAQISTENAFRFKYGKIEIRAKLPKGDWLFPRLMLRSVHQNEPDIKIAFALGNEDLENISARGNVNVGGKRLSGGLIFWNMTKNVRYETELKPVFKETTHINDQHMGNDFHTYTLNWTPTALTFGFDGITYGTIQQELSDEYYFVVGVSAGGHYDFPEAKEKPWENLHPRAILRFWEKRDSWEKTWKGDQSHLQIDYIKVYAL